jgi:hypothetical protein
MHDKRVGRGRAERATANVTDSYGTSLPLEYEALPAFHAQDDLADDRQHVDPIRVDGDAGLSADGQIQGRDILAVIEDDGHMAGLRRGGCRNKLTAGENLAFRNWVDLEKRGGGELQSRAETGTLIDSLGSIADAYGA